MRANLTQRRLAELLNLSYPTVNRALNGYAGVREHTRQRILDAADRLGYRKNIVARNLVMQRTHSIGMVMLNTGHSFWGLLLESLESQARQLGYHVIICHSGPGHGAEDEAINFLVERQVDGLILRPNHLRHDFSIFHHLIQARIPLLFLDSFLTGVRASFLGLDDVGGSILACRHLIKLGHQRLAFVAGPSGDMTADRRLAGYRQALQEAGLPSDKELIVPAEGFLVEHGQQAARRLLEIHPRPTGVLAVNDPVAFGIAQVLREHGLDIPNDIALIGAAGMPEGELLPSPLTTVAPPTAKLGQRAAEIIIKLIESKRPKIVWEELPCQLLVRASCGAPKDTTANLWAQSPRAAVAQPPSAPTVP